MRRSRRDRRERDREDFNRPRDPLEIAIEPLPMRPIHYHLLERPEVRDLEDRRRYHPEAFNAPLAAAPTSARRVVERVIAPGYPGALHRTRLALHDPSHVSQCVRRQERREVLLAKGRGGGGNKAPKWTELSRKGCK